MMSEKFLKENINLREKIFKEHKIKPKVWQPIFANFIKSCGLRATNRSPIEPITTGSDYLFLFPEENNWEFNLLQGGFLMEITNETLKVINLEVDESKKILQNLVNEIKILHNIVEPALLKAIQDMRTARMTMVSEVSQSLKLLGDVRKFFFEKDYDEEMKRLERFVNICKEIKKLKDDGVFDAVCDSALKLAIGKE